MTLSMNTITTLLQTCIYYNIIIIIILKMIETKIDIKIYIELKQYI